MSSTRRWTTARWPSRTADEVAPQHARLIDRATARFAADPRVVAVIVGGSVAHGYARPDSDVDLVVVLEAEDASRTFTDHSVADYPGGYLDGKLVTRDFLREVAARGSEPARWAFRDAFVTYTRDPEVPELVRWAAAYPEDGVEERLRTFIAYLLIHVWFMGEADKRGDPYLATYAASKVTLFAGRAVLAHNRALYPFHKWFLRELERLGDRPPELLDLIHGVLREPVQPRARELADCVTAFCGVELEPLEPAERFLAATEWSWRDGRASPEDL
jgi:predicted nucleotidyltransferase